MEQMTSPLDASFYTDYVSGLYQKRLKEKVIQRFRMLRTCLYPLDSSAPIIPPRLPYQPQELSPLTHEILPKQIGIIAPNVPERARALRDIFHETFTRAIMKTVKSFSTVMIQNAEEPQLCSPQSSRNVCNSPDELIITHSTTCCPFLIDGVSYTVKDIAQLSTVKLLKAHQRHQAALPIVALCVDHLEDGAFISQTDTKCIVEALHSIEELLSRRIKIPFFFCYLFIANRAEKIQSFCHSETPVLFDFSKKVNFVMRSIAPINDSHHLVKKGAIRFCHPVPAIEFDIMQTKAYIQAKAFCSLRIRKMLSLHTQSRTMQSEKRSVLDALCDVRTGILVHGDSGSGKTTLLYDLVNTFTEVCPFYSIVSPLLLSCYVGETERNVRSLFQFLRSKAPCVYTFEALDAVAMMRGDQQANILCALLCELDGIGSDNAHILGIATTDKALGSLDPAIIRPGRFGAFCAL